MAIKNKVELLSQLNTILGDNNNTDEALALFDDITDTMDDYESKTKDPTDWKAKYEENDKAWRNKYRERFMNGTQSDPEPIDDPDSDPVEKPLKYDDLFKEE